MPGTKLTNGSKVIKVIKKVIFHRKTPYTSPHEEIEIDFPET
jgi:hypothetical protein